MKKILYVINEGLRKFTYERTAGLFRAIQKADEPINLYILRSDGYTGFSPEHNRGESNIFQLPDYEDFDGILLDLNSNFDSGIDAYGAGGVLHCIRQAEASGKPVLSMANFINGFHYVGVDNYEAMTSVIRHLNQNMGLTDFWFAMGPENNYENQIRTQAIWDYCHVSGLPCEQERFYAESYVEESGVHAFETLYERHGRLPQAVICANDSIAVGVCRAAKKAGFEVPRDFYATGFDNLDISAYLSPSLTTVDQMCWTMGDTCIEILQKIWRGEEVPLVIHTPTRLMLRQSTGNYDTEETDLSRRMAEYSQRDMRMTEFRYRLSAMQYELPTCGSIEDICNALTRCVSFLKCNGLYLLMDRNLRDMEGPLNFDERLGGVQNFTSGLTREGYPQTMELVYAWEKGKAATFPCEPVSGILPALESKGDRENFLLLPLHFGEHTVGYLAIWECVEMMRLKCVSPIVNTLTMALHNFFANRRLAHVNHVLSGISMKDDLTGLYNRLGYNNLASHLFRTTHERGDRLGILFLDMDGMKSYNDTHGHAYGDLAILSVSNAISRCIPEDAIAVRYGGDEFLIFMPMDEGADGRATLAGILGAIPREAEKLGMPDAPGISAGYVLTDPRECKTLQDYVEEADGLMYEDKRERKTRMA